MKEPLSGIKHPAYRDALALTRAGGRTATGRYLVEDVDMVRQALQSPSDVFAVFAEPSEVATLEPLCAAKHVPLYIASGGLITKLVGTGYETAVTAVAVVGQNVIASASLFSPPDEMTSNVISSASLVLCGERIQDPRNVGVLIRTAEAAGCAGLLLSADSAEPFSRQAVRSTTGSILRLPLSLVPDLPQTLRELRASGVTVIASSGQADVLVYQADLSLRPLVLLVGNEQHGITEALRAAADLTVRLPMKPGGADSYNVTVAAGMLVGEALRARTQLGEYRTPTLSPPTLVGTRVR